MDNAELTRLAVKLLEREAQKFVRERSIIKPGPLKANKQFLSNTLKHNEISNKRINQKLERNSSKASEDTSQKDKSPVQKRKLSNIGTSSHQYSKDVSNGKDRGTTSTLSQAPAPSASTSMGNNFKNKKKILPIMHPTRKNDKVVPTRLTHLTCVNSTIDLDSDDSKSSSECFKNDAIKGKKKTFGSPPDNDHRVTSTRGNKSTPDSPENISQFCIWRGLFKPPESDKGRNESKNSSGSGKVITISDSKPAAKESVICLDDSDSSSTSSYCTKTKRKATKHKKTIYKFSRQ